MPKRSANFPELFISKIPRCTSPVVVVRPPGPLVVYDDQPLESPALVRRRSAI